uniref:Reverse transcriptase domain-containing protein n=1 Tax=Caenorhabditis japonica TaxID=281687 RepID=A0A8R1ELC9_CAEJA
MIHAGQTKNADLAKINNEVRRSLEMIWTNGEKLKVSKPRTAGWINDIQSSRDQEASSHSLLQSLGIESIAPHLTAALNQVLTNGRTPEDWKTVKISLLPKTTKPKKVKDYRPVALSSIVSKLFTKILTRRITAKSEDYLEESHAGCRRGRGCADNIQVVAQMWEKCTEFKIPLVAVFLDFTCAFDNVNWTKISQVLNNLQIGRNVIRALNNSNFFGDWRA